MRDLFGDDPARRAATLEAALLALAARDEDHASVQNDRGFNGSDNPFTEAQTALFWSHVRRDGPVPAHRPELGPCWPWTGALSDKGYGKVKIAGKVYRTNRVAWMVARGPIPEGLQALHHCDYPPCCNDTHLFLGTSAVNSADMVEKRRQQVGEARPNAKLTEQDVLDIRFRYRSGGVSQQELAVQFGVTRTAIEMIIQGKRWTHVG